MTSQPAQLHLRNWCPLSVRNALLNKSAGCPPLLYCYLQSFVSMALADVQICSKLRVAMMITSFESLQVFRLHAFRKHLADYAEPPTKHSKAHLGCVWWERCTSKRFMHTSSTSGGERRVDMTRQEGIVHQVKGAEGISHCGKARTPDWGSLCHWGYAECQVGIPLDQDRPQQPHCQGSDSRGRGAGCTCGASQSRTMSPRCSQAQTLCLCRHEQYFTFRRALHHSAAGSQVTHQNASMSIVEDSLATGVALHCLLSTGHCTLLQDTCCK